VTTGRRVVSARSLVAESEIPVHEAIRLLEKASGRSRARLASDDAVDEATAAEFGGLVRRRRRGEPLHYLEGSSQFGPIELAVDPRVLIPRPETEQLWELVTARLAGDAPRVVVDLGTGSANLAIALQHSFPEAEIHAVDVSAEALEVARSNVAAAGAPIRLHHGDLFAPLPGRLRGTVDLVISNPPYVGTSERFDLPAEVREHEPEIALFAGDDGLAVLLRIIAAAPGWLRPGGWLACEIGSGHGDAVRRSAAGLEPRIIRDLSGRDRFLIAQKGVV